MKIEKSYSNLRETGDAVIIQRFPKEQSSLLLAEQQRRKKTTRVKIRKPRQAKKAKLKEKTEIH